MRKPSQCEGDVKSKETKLTTHRVHRRAAIALLAAAALGLTACAGGGAPQADPDAPVTLRFTWWGGDLRNQMTLDAIAAFEEEHPNITIAPEWAPFDVFFARGATQVAAGDAPDIIQMPEGFFSEYVGRGALLDLSELDIDHGDIPDSVWKTGEVDDALWGVPAGVSTYGIIANNALFEQAGIELPDDSTWTWDDYAELATELSDALPDGLYGSQTPGTDQNTLGVWLRQDGAQLFEPGELGFEPDDAASFFQFITELRDSGAIPPAEEVSEQMGIDLAQSGTGTNRYALGFWASNQLKNIEAASGSDMTLLKFPTKEGSDADGEFAMNTMWYTAYAGTDHPAEVAQFMDFLINSPEAGAITLTERGAPANTKVVESITDKLDPADVESVAFLDSVREVALETPPASPPTGASGFQEVLRRMVVEVAFNRLTPDQAAEQLVSEVSSQIR